MCGRSTWSPSIETGQSVSAEIGTGWKSWKSAGTSSIAVPASSASRAPWARAATNSNPTPTKPMWARRPSAPWTPRSGSRCSTGTVWTKPSSIRPWGWPGKPKMWTTWSCRRLRAGLQPLGGGLLLRLGRPPHSHCPYFLWRPPGGGARARGAVHQRRQGRLFRALHADQQVARPPGLRPLLGQGPGTGRAGRYSPQRRATGQTGSPALPRYAEVGAVALQRPRRAGSPASVYGPVPVRPVR